MPYTNYITIYASQKFIDEIVECNGDLYTLVRGCSVPKEYRISNYELSSVENGVIWFTITSDVEPINHFLEFISGEYKIEFIKNYWYGETTEGIWIAEEDKEPRQEYQSIINFMKIKEIEWSEPK